MNTFDRTWETVHQNQDWGEYPSENIIRFIARNYYRVDDRGKIRILDFGCGTGANTWYLAKEGFDVYAFDGSETAIMKAREKLGNMNLKAEFSVLDAGNLNYKDNFFNCIVDNVCVFSNQIESIRFMYKEIYRMLKSGGRLISTSFGTKTTGFGTGNELEYHTFDNLTTGNLAGHGIKHFWTQLELYFELAEAGFKNIIIDVEERTEKNQEQLTEMFIVSAVK